MARIPTHTSTWTKFESSTKSHSTPHFVLFIVSRTCWGGGCQVCAQTQHNAFANRNVPGTLLQLQQGAWMLKADLCANQHGACGTAETLSVHSTRCECPFSHQDARPGERAVFFVQGSHQEFGGGAHSP